ncbi:MAG: D-aminoacyl-tRNA deacylase [Myxococcota bacterium]|jgi:D-tyrosyl-tRNA(Tyr) deacylase|nr:D-aminoacyl-tRNA deacylase [Myxococcota bacterium]
MRAVIQRVGRAKVSVSGETTGEIGLGLLILLGVAPEDDKTIAQQMADKIVNLRIFPDAEEKMNLSLLDVQGSALVVSQFTLFADCTRGRRPYFGDAAEPQEAEELCGAFKHMLRDQGLSVESGRFGAMMDVELLNHGPVTIILDSQELKRKR